LSPTIIKKAYSERGRFNLGVVTRLKSHTLKAAEKNDYEMMLKERRMGGDDFSLKHVE